MFDPRFNNHNQGMVPYTGQDMNQMPQAPYAQSPYGRSAYRQGQSNQGNTLSNMMSNNTTPYPTQVNVPPGSQGQPPINYADGGSVKKKKKNNYHALAETLRKKGNNGDTILAHINPLEDMMLKGMGGSGTINPQTGLPQYGLFSNPKKWFKSVAGPAGGAILGNMLLPGIGGIIGGTLGGAAGSAIRGRHDLGQAALRGAGIGAMLPSAASLLGSGATALGAKGVGSGLTQYGTTNAILPALGLGNMFGGEAAAAAAGMEGAQGAAAAGMEGAQGAAAAQAASQAAAKGAAEQSFADQLISNSKSFLTKPKNLLTMGVLASSMLNRPKPLKEKTPEQVADEQKRLEIALRLSPEERSGMEANLLAEEQMRRRIARNKFLPEERLGNIEPIYRKTHTPAEYKKTGRWISYYNNPEFTGKPITYQEGGPVTDEVEYEAEGMEYPSGLGQYIQGNTGGQDDKIEALLSDGEYVIPADAVAHLGDGNNTAGAKKLDGALEKIRKHRGRSINSLPPKAKSLADYLK